MLGGEPGPAEHVEKIGVAAGVELISPLNLYAAFPEKIDHHAVKYGGAELGFDVVPDNGQIFIGETFRPNRIAGDEDGNIVYKRDAGFERATGIEPSGLFGANRQIIDHDLGGGVFQLGNDLF